MARRSYYDILGVAKGATDKEVRAAYRRLARKHHPDVNPGDKAAESRFKEINEAYQVLSDPESRKKYDQLGENWKHADRMAGAAAGGRGGRGYGGWSFQQRRGGRPSTAEPSGGFDFFGDIFEQFGRGGEGFAMPGQDVETPVEVTLEEAFHGATRLVQTAAKRLEVKVPPGVNTGSRIRIAGEGAPSAGGDRKGDLWLVVTVLPHAQFRREGDDLHVDAPVPLADAILGGEVQVATLRGAKLALKLPAGTQNGRVFRLRGQGMPALRRGEGVHAGEDRDGGGPGDLFAKVMVVLPGSLTAEERAVFEKMKLRGGGAGG